MIAIITLIVLTFQSSAMDTLTLDYCYSRVETNYPLAYKMELQEKITELSQEIIATGNYPQLRFGASASWQSEVTEFPGGAAFAPQLSQDHYKVSVDVSQTIYNGGIVGIRKNLEEVRGDQQQISTEVQLHQLKKQVNQVYFGILLAQKQQEVIGVLIENLRAQLQTVKSKVENGVLLASQQYTLKAELIKAQQDSIEVRSNILAGYEVLGELIGKEVLAGTLLKTPDMRFTYLGDELLPKLRPEFALFKSNRLALDYQQELAGAKKWPLLAAFGTAAYGRPGFNVFENDLHPFYMLGLRLQWNFWDWNNADRQQQILELKQQSIIQEQQAFEWQLQANLSEIRNQIKALREQIERDRDIINLREKVVSQLSSQLKQGVVTATEYITELNKATQAHLSTLMHEIQLSKAKVKYQTALGIGDQN
ncbi:MAG TPA: TolC family protein [Balneolaceae bacterium]|nr:TolC family protein [Balneolaceae bacterium]